MSKQDRQGARTVADLERRYSFGKRFSEVIGVATDAREMAEDVNESFENVWASDIYMTGKFLSEAEAYLPPTYDDCVYTLRSVILPDKYPMPEGYDFDLNGDGVFNEDDAILAYRVFKGEIAMKDCPGAKKTPVSFCIDMSNSEKTIRLYGKNMWGTDIDVYIGSDVFNSSFVAKAYLDSIVQVDDDMTTLFRYVDGTKEYFNPPMKLGAEYRTVERMLDKPVYTMVTGATASIEGTIIRSSATFTIDGLNLVQVWYIK